MPSLTPAKPACPLINTEQQMQFGENLLIVPGENVELSDIQMNHSGNAALTIGEGVFGSGVIRAPDANIVLGTNSTWRGRLAGQRVVLQEGSIVTQADTFNIPSSAADVVEDPDGGLIIVNEVLVNLEEGVSVTTLQPILEEVNGLVVGHIAVSNEYKIRIAATTVQELEDAIGAIKALNVGGVEIVSKNELVYPN